MMKILQYDNSMTKLFIIFSYVALALLGFSRFKNIVMDEFFFISTVVLSER